ncbi:HIRAN domain-containing protein [Thiomicrorhabdus indica]|uniref:HIRAN domain-containing protein n=1 Tax=Thiomicrorhabdus indica TaxID=2267253 RepID=UPI00102DB670|nr:HIRAN domain-containing protein [Thiomicrorhabdus indica]
MIVINNPIHVNTLFLTWQSNKDRHQRYLVGEIKRQNDKHEFSYLTQTQDYASALEQGFLGYPAFPLNKGTFSNDVMATFMKRLPPRSRRDFKKYLTNHNLPETFDGSDFDLITHTGVQLPSDGFDLIPNLEEATIPFDYLMELAGTRYYLTYEEVSNLDINSVVELKTEDSNEYDNQAITVLIDNKILGYINKLLCPTVRKLMDRNIECKIAKKSGTQDRPLIYVMLRVR